MATFQIESGIKREYLLSAVLNRDPKFHHAFLYGVNSTKIFCRPTCPSKRPENVSSIVFFENAIEARKEGFRACLRCKPEELSPQVEQVMKLCQFIRENSSEKLTLERLSIVSGQSPFHLQRTFKKVTGVTPKEYVEVARLGRVKNSLRSGESIRNSTYNAGYNTTGWLYFRPGDKLGMSPLDYKNGGKGSQIYYSITNSPLGKLLVAATERGICSVSLGEKEGELLEKLRREFPNAAIYQREKDQEFNKWVEAIISYLRRGNDLADASLPLDIRVTAFQWKVLKALRSIPHGQVRAYSEIARQIGLPKATRAVANACGANPVPLVIPCHRVIRKNGNIGGYGLGIERKKILLKKEGFDVSKLVE